MIKKATKIKANKNLGQNFLSDTNTLVTMCDTAEVSNKDTVIEIGPGPASLTQMLIGSAKKVIAIEKDRRFEYDLEALRIANDNFDYVIEDVLKCDLSEMAGGEYKIIANIPYYITADILNVILKQKVRPSVVVIMVQKEVAANWSDKKRVKNIQSLILKSYTEIEYIKTVPRNLFSPAPKVDSAIVKISFLPQSIHDTMNDKKMLDIAKKAFSGKRKMISNTLSAVFGKEGVLETLNNLGIDPSARPENLTIHNWIALRNAYDNRVVK